MISLEQSRQSISEAVAPLEAVRAPLQGALGRVLRENANAKEDMPAFDRSAMDGYAVKAEDTAERFKIIGEARPGKRAGFAVHAGECARIFTGAEIPEGASRVIRQEDAHVEDGWMTRKSSEGPDFIRRRGEDARAGDLVLASGTRLGVAEIALLANLGVTEPMVSAQCRVAHFATGDELVDPTRTPGPGQIRDSNSALVRAFVAEQGAEMTHQERVPDDVNALMEKLEVHSGCDLFLISGGASVGDYDFGRAALLGLGFKMHFEKMNLRPGKPLAFATCGHKVAFVLPGNPLSHLTVLHCVVRVAFERLAGEEPSWPVLDARLASGFRAGGDGRDTLWPGRVEFTGGEAVVQPLRWQSSGDLTGLAGLNAFIRCNVPVLDTGARVACILING